MITMETTGTTTTYLDLNDDCLREVFASLYAEDLAVVADVCARFRAIAAKSVQLKCATIRLSEWSSVDDFSQLRNFGALVDSVDVYGECRMKPLAKYQKRFIELLVQYCGKSVELVLNDFNITDELAFLMRPLLGRVEHLSFINCRIGKVFLEKMASWSPEIRELKYRSCNLSKTIICQKFPKLEYIDFRQIKYVKNSDIEELFELNPQLKQFGMVSCQKLDDNIFQSIARYVPEIVEMRFETAYKTNISSIEYLGRLRAMKAIAMEVKYDRSYIPSAVDKMSGANIALESLELSEFDNSQRFMEGISRLEKLKSLQLYYVGKFTSTHLIDICKHLKELSELGLFGTDLKMTKDDLIKFIQNAQQLRNFVYDIREREQSLCTNIDVDTFQELVRIVDQRTDKIALTLHLDDDAFTADVPVEIIRAANKVLILDMYCVNVLLK